MNNRLSQSRVVQVVKVTRTGPGPAVVIHDRERRHVAHVFPGDLPGWLVLALEKSPKVYARAAWTGATWAIVGVKQAVGQSW
jgi:hypothetical protein